MTLKKRTLHRLRLGTLLSLIFLLPLVFTPNFGGMFNLIKGIVLMIGVMVLLILWVIDVYKAKEFKIKINWVNSIILLIWLSLFLSLIANIPFISSLIGGGQFTGFMNSLIGKDGTFGLSFLTITLLTIFYFNFTAIVNSQKEINWILRMFCFSAVLVSLFSILKYLFPTLTVETNSFLSVVLHGYNFTSLSFPSLYPSQNFSTLGEYYVLPLFLIISLVFHLHLINFKNKTYSKINIFNYSLLFILIFSFVITTWGNAFSVVFFILAILSIGLVLVKKNSLEEFAKLVWKNLTVVVIVAIISASVLIKVQNIETVTSPLLPFDISWSAAFSNYGLGNSIKNGLFGVGAENFSVPLLQSRPASINGTSLAFENINHSGNFVLDTLNQIGIIGFLIHLFIVIKILFFIRKSIRQEYSIIFPIIIIFIVVLVSMFLIPFNLSILFILFIVLAIFSVEQKGEKSLVLNLEKRRFRLTSSDKSTKNLFPLIFISFVAIWTIFSLVYLFFLISQHLANYNSLTSVTITSENIDKAIAYSETSTSGIPISKFNARLGDLNVQKLAMTLNGISTRLTQSTPLTQVQKDTIDSLSSKALENYTKAIQIEPLNYENYYSLSKFYILLATRTSDKTARDDYLVQSYSSMANAISLNPQNPYLYTQLGDLYSLQGDSVNALSNYNEAIKRTPLYALNYFPDLIGPFAKYSNIEYQIKEYDSAIQTLQTLQKYIDPENNVYKLIFEQIQKIESDKNNIPKT